MRGKFLESLIVCVAAVGPLRAIAGDTILWRAWIDFASSSWIKYYGDGFGFRWSTRFILPCAFLCLSMSAQVRAALDALRQRVLR